MSYYSREITYPQNMREGLSNALQHAINLLESGDTRETLLQLVDIQNDINSNANPYRIETGPAPAEPENIGRYIPNVGWDDMADVNPVKVYWPDGSETAYPCPATAAGAVAALRFNAVGTGNNVNDLPFIAAGLDIF